MAIQQIDDYSAFEIYYTDEDTGLPITEEKSNVKYKVRSDGTINLGEHPQEELRVTIEEGTNTLSEVLNQDEVSIDTFFVDYKHDKVWLDPDRANTYVYVTYYSTGCTAISANRVVTKLDEEEGIVQTLQDIIDGNEAFIQAQTTYSSTDDVIDSINSTKTNAISAMNTSVSDSKAELQEKIDEADEKVAEIDSMVTDCIVPMFIGSLSDDMKTIKSAYKNKDNCVTDSTTDSTLTYITFTVPYDGVYEFDGRCVSSGGGSFSISAKIGRSDIGNGKDDGGYLINITKDLFVGVTNSYK